MSSPLQPLATALLTLVAASVFADINLVTLLKGDGSYAKSSFLAAGNWSNDEAPAAPEEGAAVTNHYLVALGPGSENALWLIGWYNTTHTFAGVKLTIGTDEVEGALRLSNNRYARFNFPELVLHSGEILIETESSINTAGNVETTAEKPFRIIPLNAMGGTVNLSGPEEAVVLVKGNGIGSSGGASIAGANYLGKVIFEGNNGTLASPIPSFGGNHTSRRNDAIEVRNGASFYHTHFSQASFVTVDLPKLGFVVDAVGTKFENRHTSYSLHKPLYLKNFLINSQGEVQFSHATGDCPFEHGVGLSAGSLNNPEGAARIVAQTNTLLLVENDFTFPEGTIIKALKGGTIAIDASRIPSFAWQIEEGWLHAGGYGYFRGNHNCASEPQLCPYLHPGVSADQCASAGSPGWYVHPRPNTGTSIGADAVALKNATFINGGFKCDIDIKDETCINDCFTLDESCTFEGTIKLAATVAIPLANNLSKSGWTLLKVPTSVRTLKESDFDLSNCFFDTDDGTDPEGLYSPAVRIETVDGMQNVVLYRKRTANPTIIFLR